MVIGIQDEILKINSQHLLDRLLMDKTTKSNIIWATDAYTELGTAYHRDKEITVDLITGQHSGVIKNRARKALEQQSERTRKHAEVFTPLWICEKMNDHIDEMWFGRKQGIHKTDPETGHIVFTSSKKWRYYVDSRRLEITCGEAPWRPSIRISKRTPLFPTKRKMRPLLPPQMISLKRRRVAKEYNWKVDYMAAPTGKSTNKKEGCYIATAVYGSYDAPQVMTLRRYRDEILRATAFGRWFIRAYYRLSPPVAEKLKNAKHINKFVRSILDKWVEKLNRRFCA